MSETAPIATVPFVELLASLITHGDVRQDVSDEYRRYWPESVSPLPAYRARFPAVVLVDRTISLRATLERANVALGAVPESFLDVPEAVATTQEMSRYVIYAHDGLGRFGRKVDDALAGFPADELPLTLVEGAFLTLLHARRRTIRHCVVCAGTRDQAGRIPVIAATSRGYVLEAVRGDDFLYRYAVASRGAIIPSAV